MRAAAAFGKLVWGLRQVCFARRREEKKKVGSRRGAEARREEGSWFTRRREGAKVSCVGEGARERRKVRESCRSPHSSSRRTSGPMDALVERWRGTSGTLPQPWAPAFAGVTNEGAAACPRGRLLCALCASARKPLLLSAPPRLRVNLFAASRLRVNRSSPKLRTKPPSPNRSPCSCRGSRRGVPSVRPLPGPCPSSRSRRVRP